MQEKRTTYQSASDEQLVAYMQQGDQGGFDELYHRYATALHRYFCRMLKKDSEKSADFVHDLFAKLIKDPTYFDVSRTFKTWMYAVANNMCKNEYRKWEVRKDMLQGVDEHKSVQDVDSNVVKQVQEVMFRERFESGMDRLDPKHREVFHLRHIEGLSVREVSELLEISEGTVKSRLFYAVKYLAAELNEYNPQVHRS